MAIGNTPWEAAQSNPSHGILLQEAQWPNSGYPGDGRKYSQTQCNQRQNRTMNP
jgi:hypothetical protein